MYSRIGIRMNDDSFWNRGFLEGILNTKYRREREGITKHCQSPAPAGAEARLYLNKLL
jgi:hypothetical protein